jgi:SAM-dependent methyltransferase
MEPVGGNAEQIRFWNEIGAPRWIRFQRALDTQIGPLGERAMERAALRPGDRVLDVGCGCGTTTLTLAERVAPSGTVLGVDVAGDMIEVGRATAKRAGVRNVSFEEADAQEHAFPAATFDVVFSRFGVMFFTDPVRAFTNLRTALRGGGRLSFVCWQAALLNPWVAVPLGAAAAVLPLPPPPAPDAPGPFAFADADRVRRILSQAGFGGVQIDELREVLTIGGHDASLDDVIDFLLQLGPLGAAIRQADPALAPKVGAAIRDALAPLHTARGLEMGSAAWLVTAAA